MPELPEVETIKNDLKEKIVGKTISDADSNWPTNIKEVSLTNFRQAIKGKKIVDVRRRAKNLIIDLSEGLSLIFHLKMTGHLIVAPKNKLKGEGWISETETDPLSDRVNQYIHLVFYLNGEVLALSDLRKFAWVRLMVTKEVDDFLQDFGPEPLDKNFTFEAFKEQLRNKRGPIKKILMDQKIIAGIGNIYADEILFAAKISPLRGADDLNDKELKAIYEAIKPILKNALQRRGTSTSDYRDTSGKKGTYGDIRKVYQKTGEPCPNGCGGTVKRVKINSRSAHYCPSCQK